MCTNEQSYSVSNGIVCVQYYMNLYNAHVEMFGHLLRHNLFMKNILERRINGH